MTEFFFPQKETYTAARCLSVLTILGKVLQEYLVNDISVIVVPLHESQQRPDIPFRMDI